jgi:hypothetical protein
MAKAFKKKSNNSPKQFTGGGSGKDYYSGLQKETAGGKTYAIEPTGEKTLLDEEGDPVMDIEMNPHLYPEYTAKFANNPNPDVEIKPTPGIKDTQDQMAWNQKWNRQEEASRNRSAFRKEVKFQKSLQSSGEEIAGTPKEVAQEIIYPGQDNSVWQNPTGATPEVLQQNRINALVSAGMTVEDATKQVTTGTPVNKTVLPEGSTLGTFRGKQTTIMPTPDINRDPNAYKGFAIDMSGYTPEVVAGMKKVAQEKEQTSKRWTKPSTPVTSTTQQNLPISGGSTPQQNLVEQQNRGLTQEQAQTKRSEIIKKNFGITPLDNENTIINKVREFGPFVYGSDVREYPFIAPNGKKYFVTRDGKITSSSSVKEEQDPTKGRNYFKEYIGTPFRKAFIEPFEE